MPGRYTFFVATGIPTVQLSICSIAVFGTRYIRAQTLTDYFVIQAGTQAVLNVPDVYAEDVIADTLTIDIVQKASSVLQFVTIANGASSADVTINASSLLANATPYPMVLESSNTSSALPTLVLKTDKLNIYVTDYVRNV